MSGRRARQGSDLVPGGALPAPGGCNEGIGAGSVLIDRNLPVLMGAVALAAPEPERNTARAMSQENVEIVRRSTDAYNRRDLDGILENWAPDAVLDWSNSHGFDAGVYRGHGEIREFLQRFLATWEEVRFELVDGPVEVEDGLLVAENVANLRGRD